MIEINNLSFSYDNQKQALENINIKTAERTITAILGHDGAGKTTLLNKVLSNQEGYKVAVIVNDIGEVNFDEKLIKK